jgi:hypothetical protein
VWLRVCSRPTRDAYDPADSARSLRRADADSLAQRAAVQGSGCVAQVPHRRAGRSRAALSQRTRRAGVVQLVPNGECSVTGSAVVEGASSLGLTPLRLPIRTWTLTRQSVCPVDGTCPCEGAAERLPRWPPVFGWGRLERRSPWWPGCCAPRANMNCDTYLQPIRVQR